MEYQTEHHDALRRWVQVADSRGIQLVRITAHDESNRYTARPIAFDADGGTEIVGERSLTVVNLTEPLDGAGRVPADTDAVALDAGGRWIVFIRPPSTAVFPAKVTASQGAAAYTVREQVATGAGAFADRSGGLEVTAHNLAELSLGDGAAVDTDSIVIVHAMWDNGQTPTLRYVFDHPAYAKYLD